MKVFTLAGMFLGLALSAQASDSDARLNEYLNLMRKSGVQEGLKTHKVTESEPKLGDSGLKIRIITDPSWCGPCMVIDEQVTGYREGMRQNAHSHDGVQFESGRNKNFKVPFEVLDLNKLPDEEADKAQAFKVHGGIPETQIVDSKTGEILVAFAGGFEGYVPEMQKIAKNIYEYKKAGGKIDPLVPLAAKKQTQIRINWPEIPAPSVQSAE